jgi:hypothetical protein
VAGVALHHVAEIAVAVAEAVAASAAEIVEAEAAHAEVVVEEVETEAGARPGVVAVTEADAEVVCCIDGIHTGKRLTLCPLARGGAKVIVGKSDLEEAH